MPLKRIDFETGEVVGKSGKLYTTSSSLSVERYSWFQMYEKELAYGLTVKGLSEKLQKLYELNNKMKFADAAVMINDMIRGVVKIQERQPAILKICALYINTEDEDLSIINQDMIDKKIKDWAEYDVQDFFRVAISFVDGLIKIYLEITQSISSLQEMENES